MPKTTPMVVQEWRGNGKGGCTSPRGVGPILVRSWASLGVLSSLLCALKTLRKAQGEAQEGLNG